jgi:hypothetical protein
MAQNYFSLPRFDPGDQSVNFAPVNNALEGYRQQSNQNALMAQRQEEQTYQRGRDQQQDARVAQQDQRQGQEAVAKRMFAFSQLPPEQRDPRMWGSLLSEFKKYRPNDGNDPDDMDPIKGPAAFAAAYGGMVRDPREDQLMDLKVQGARADLQNAQRGKAPDLQEVYNDQGQKQKVIWDGSKYVPVGGSSSVAESRGIKPPAGYLWNDPDNPEAGVSPIPGYEQTIPGEVAGKVAMMNMARERIAKTRAALERSWGAADIAKNAAANVPLIGDIAVASGDIGVAQRDVRTGIEATLRTMTGAAAPEQEVKRYMEMFAPGIKDTKETAKQKLDGLMKFMEDADKIVMQGRGKAPNLGNTSAPISSGRVMDLGDGFSVEVNQ